MLDSSSGEDTTATALMVAIIIRPYSATQNARYIGLLRVLIPVEELSKSDDEELEVVSIISQTCFSLN